MENKGVLLLFLLAAGLVGWWWYNNEKEDGDSTDSTDTTKQSQAKPSQALGCFIRMPTGCDSPMHETKTPQQWFEDLQGNGGGCAARVPKFNEWCNRADAQYHVGTGQPPMCWMRLPSGCPTGLSETQEPTQWFADSAGSLSSETCRERMTQYNTHCGKTDAEINFASEPP
jgi:hypothetical protein